VGRAVGRGDTGREFQIKSVRNFPRKQGVQHAATGVRSVEANSDNSIAHGKTRNVRTDGRDNACCSGSQRCVELRTCRHRRD
jgi:hypothetical protein